MAEPYPLPTNPLRYAEVYSADEAKVGSLARIQDAAPGLLRIEVGGYLTPDAGCLTLRISQLRFCRDRDDVMVIHALYSKSGCLSLLMRQNAARKKSPRLVPLMVRWWGIKAVRPIFSRR